MGKITIYSEVHRKGISVIGAHGFAPPKYKSYHGWRILQDEGHLILELLSKGRLKVEDLVPLQINFSDAGRSRIQTIDRFEG
jgi:hypothetical protein